MMSISRPTAARIWRKGSSARSRSAARDVVAAARLGVGVERPDLHAGDPLLAQAQRQLAGPVQEGVEILVGPFGLLRHLRYSPVADLLPGAGPHIAVAGTGVVDADAIPAGTSQQLVDRLTDRAPEDVPERDVDRRVAAPLDAAGGIADVRVKARACLSMWRGSFPSRYGATVSWMYASTASAPKKVSPRPVTPSSVCTRTQMRFGNSPSRSVSTALTFTSCLRRFPLFPRR